MLNRPGSHPQRSLDASRLRAAFTLAELIIVVLIIGIMASLSIPAFVDTLQLYRVDAAALRIKLDLELARRQAKMKSASQSVQFNVDGNSYTLPGVPHLDHPGSTYAVKLSETNYSATLVSAVFGGDATVVFNGYGLPDSAGTVVVRSGSRTRTVSLEANSGKVTLP